MQLTRFDRWLLEEFVHETHVYTLSPPDSLPRGVREEPLPDTPGRRYQHHFVASDSKSGDALCAQLKKNGQMFATQVTDRKAWYVPIIAPRGKSITWRIVWILFTCITVLSTTIYLKNLWDTPGVQKMIGEAYKTLKG